MRRLIEKTLFIFCIYFTVNAEDISKQELKTISFSKEDLRLEGKKGVCFTLRDPKSPKTKKRGGGYLQNMKRVKALNPSWNYSWGLDLVPVQPRNIEFIPMTWAGGHADKLKDTLSKKVSPLIKVGKMKRLLGFNEPDKKEQANMPFMKAIELWPALMSMEVPLCSPSCANPEGVDDESVQGVSGTWLRDFMREADKRKYRVDYIGVHWYGGTSAKYFKEKLKRIYLKYGKRPLLITEFAPADWKAKTPKGNRHSPAKVLKFMKEVLPWFEKQDWIAGYAWFSFSITSSQGTSSALLDEEGSLTACGRYYKSITPSNPNGDMGIKPDSSHFH